MNKSEIIAAVAQKTGQTRVLVESVVENTVDAILEALKSGDEVKIYGFGGFKPVKSAPRRARNPKTGEEIDIPARVNVKFKQATVLIEQMNRRR